jgi:tRNA threonylcarbamoyladenosine biosynthesis protein TsaB
MKLLAIDTSTERMSLAVCHGGQVWEHQALAGAQASGLLIPAILALLAQASLPLNALNAIAFGRGPGAFTGLRTACSVAQGLALGAGLPLLPIDTLLCLAESSRLGLNRVLAMLDARMGQVYVAAYERIDGAWQTHDAAQLTQAHLYHLPPAWQGQPFALTGNALSAHQAGMQNLLMQGAQLEEVWPQASAMLRLARQAWSQGQAIAPETAAPLYVRDDVARTTAQRLADKPLADKPSAP